jgi:hypothetical protein
LRIVHEASTPSGIRKVVSITIHKLTPSMPVM